jgi:hypothetical protein
MCVLSSNRPRIHTPVLMPLLAHVEERGGRGRTPNDARKVSKFILTGRFAHVLAYERWSTMLGLFIGGQVRPCFVCVITPL